MIKTTITETTKKYDKDGKLVEETTRTETTEDDTVYYSNLYTPNNSINDFTDVKKVLYGGSKC